MILRPKGQTDFFYLPEACNGLPFAPKTLWTAKNSHEIISNDRNKISDFSN